MAITQEQISEAQKTLRLYWDSYLNGDVDSFASTLYDDFQLIGTSENEICKNKAEGIEYCRSHIEAVVGTVKKENTQLNSLVIDDLLLFNEFFDIHIKIKNTWKFYAKGRASSVLIKTPTGWKIAQQHGSIPDSQVQGNETLAFEQVSKENKELRNAIKRRTTELELKNRELEVEAALERVRNRSIGMQNGDELVEVVRLLNKEIVELGIEIDSTLIATDFDNLENGFNDWFAREGQDFLEKIHIPYIDHSIIEKVHSPLSKGPNLYSDTYSKIEKNDYFKLLFKYSDLGKISKVKKEQLFDSPGWTRITLVSKNSAVSFQRFSLQKFTDAEELVFKRFGNVFEQAYTRFLDLKRAESQAREVQIELSLERIRAQATNMQKSSDLLDIVVTMRKEFLELKNEAQYFWHMKWLPDMYEKAMTSGDGNKIGMIMTLPRHIHGDIELVDKWEKGKEATLVFPMDVDTAVSYVDKMITLGDFEQVDPNAPTLDDIRHIGGITFIMARTTHGEIGYSLPGKVTDPSAEGISILSRFAGAFDLAYRRFEDLLQAEQQAYEAMVEASLERVRGMAAAMNHSEDLIQIAEVMFKEMEILKINPLRYGLAMIDRDKREAELWASTVNDGHVLDQLGKISLTWHPMLQKAYNAWDAQHEELIYELKGPELSDYYQKIGAVNPEIPDLEALQNPDNSTTQFCSFFPFKLGTLYAFTTGKPDEDGKSILKRFSNVFEQAHIRYNDLQITEEQAQLIKDERDRLEITLKELRSTQDQLVQQEKLASLGQLTAGIAHEIKNPLNFVNNFSELSIELIEEIKEELEKYRSLRTYRDTSITGHSSVPESEVLKNNEVRTYGDTSLNEITDLLEDIETNLKNIHKHGSRADGIVKSMLQHSRGGAGKMEPTNINSMLKEFVALSFHGMRASKNPFNVDLQYELDDSIHKIGIIAEDFSRVIINLCNNAFDAMRDKSDRVKEKDEHYLPKLTVRTQRNGDTVYIEIEDNGPGIPEALKDKILQPFFTTKKGTDGTGLGLSITNDIVKAHGGELQIKSTINEGTVFSIKLGKTI